MNPITKPTKDLSAFHQQLAPLREALETALSHWINAERALPHQPWLESHQDERLSPLWEALNHSTLLGGKRVRPLICLQTYLCLTTPAFKTGKPFAPEDLKEALPLATAIELIHAQSLVFDDLPCMDNDVLRRGQPTTHVAFGEATAVLTGNALLGLAFSWLARYTPATIEPTVTVRLIAELAEAASLQGLVNGQYADIQASLTDQTLTPEWLEYIHRNKTAALLRFSLRGAGILAQAQAPVVEALDQLGLWLGLMFQRMDDWLDTQASSEQLGKTAGKDTDQNKLTYMALHGPEATQQAVTQAYQKAVYYLEQLHTLVPQAHWQPLADWINYLRYRQM